jgi:hypothetical protein
LPQLKARAAALRVEEAFHAEQQALHKRQRESCAAEMEKVPGRRSGTTDASEGAGQGWKAREGKDQDGVRVLRRRS